MNRAGGISRPLVGLLLLAVLAVGGLWLARGRQTADYTLGGPLFPVAPERIEGLLLTRGGLQFRFDRQPDSTWSLSGAANDYLDPQAMNALVAMLPTALGGAVLPGTRPDDRRYEFNGPDALRLRVFVSGGEDISLALGTANPVTGNYYASGAGRQECFPVAAPFREKLNQLPITVQAKRLLPACDRSLVQRLIVTRGRVDHEIERHNGQWWLRLPSREPAALWRDLPPLVQAYQRQYDDRRRQDERGLWILASDQVVGQMIYEVSETVVRDILSPDEAAVRLRQWELDPPWRQVVLQGAGLNPDPTAPVTNQFTIGFGPALDDKRVPALRRGNVLLTDPEAVHLLEQGLSVVLQQFALNAVARRADEMLVEREGRKVLAAGRTGPAQQDDGRGAWLTTYPPTGTMTEKNRLGLSRDLVVNLNRLEILAVLPPTRDPGVLQDKQRVRITLTWHQEGDDRQLILETGYLAQAGDEAAAGLWFPATGKLLQIPESLLVTVRNIAGYTQATAGN